MEASRLVSLFGLESGTPLALGPSGTLDLVFENGRTLTLEHDEEQDVLHCYVVLGQNPVHSAERATAYRWMLAANVFGHGTGGATLGLDETTDELLLTQRIALQDANVSGLREIVESMVEVAATWSEKLASASASSSSSAFAPSAGFLSPESHSATMPPSGLRA